MSIPKNTKAPAIEVDYLRLLNILPTEKINSKLNIKGGAEVMTCSQPLKISNTNLLANVYVDQKANKNIFCVSSVYPFVEVDKSLNTNTENEIGGAPKKAKKPVMKKPASKTKESEGHITDMNAKRMPKKKNSSKKIRNKEESIYETNYFETEEYGGVRSDDDKPTYLIPLVNGITDLSVKPKKKPGKKSSKN